MRSLVLAFVMVCAVASCRDWSPYDPREGTGSTESGSGSGAGGGVGGSGAGGGSGGAPATYVDAVRSEQPVAYWRLGEASGTTMTDEMGAMNCTYVAADLGVAGALAGDRDT